MSFFHSDDDDMPSPAYLTAAVVVTSPIWIPGVAIWGAFHGVKAVVTHGIVPGVKKIAAASSKK